jgi:hypothetical protein
LAEFASEAADDAVVHDVPFAEAAASRADLAAVTALVFAVLSALSFATMRLQKR